MKAEEEIKRKEEERLNEGKPKKSGMTKLIFANLVFFIVVVGGIMIASGNYQIFNMLGLNMGNDQQMGKG